MPTNDFKPFATAGGANVSTQAEYLALAALSTGWQSGKASSKEVNKAVRQATFIAASLAQFVSDKSGQDVLDDGDIPAFVAKLTSGFAKQYLSRSNPFSDIKTDGDSALNSALANLGLVGINVVTGSGYSHNYFKIPVSTPSGVSTKIIQFGTANTNSSNDSTIGFPIPFPNGFRTIIVSPNYTPGSSSVYSAAATANNSSITIRCNNIATIFWLAIGD